MPEEKKAAKATTAPKAARKKAAKGDTYACEVCGLSVIVDDACGCAETEIICCSEPMKEKKVKARAKA